MNEKLLENNYLIIPNFITSDRVNQLKNEFVDYCEKNNLKGDTGVTNCQAKKDYISFLELLCEKTPEISEILGETVLPTYTYARVYKNNATLRSHTDRDSCEISLTLHLGGDKSWPIWIKTPQGEDHCVELNPGDAVLYLGIDAPHWRNAYTGDSYVQCFLHYVRSRGKYFYSFFDMEYRIKERDLNKSNELDDELSEELDSSKSNELDEELDSSKSNELDEELHLSKNINENANNNTSEYLITPSSKLEDFICVFDDILSKESCDLILEEYKNTNEWEYPAISKNNSIDTEVRNCMAINISEQCTIEKNVNSRFKIDNLLYKSIQDVVNKYADIFTSFNINLDTGYELLKYEKGQFYKQHTDSFKDQQRSLSCSIQLNEDYEGGEFAFFNREMMIRTKPGSVIVFPSNFMYPHEIMPVIKGTRYSVITWLV